jgi:hypothetical protein
MTLDPSAALRLYDEAWAIPDYESRLELLRKIWADDGLTWIRTCRRVCAARKRSQTKSTDS